MCHLRGSVYAEPCLCDDYRGAVKARVHAKALREHRESNRMAREENEIMDRDEAEIRLTDQGVIVEWFGGSSLAQAADELGMPTDSETARLYFERKLPRAEAQRRAGIIRRRHEETNYDELLARGCSKDDARALTE
jgi:hypothetical protein